MNDIQKFWDSQPCNINHSSKQIGTLEYFEEVDKRRYFVEPHIIDFAQFDKWKNKKVLEIGCGIGTDAIRFARAGAKVTCIDLSKESLNICKKRFSTYGLKGSFYHGDAEKISDIIPDTKYDLIYGFGSIHHSQNPNMILTQLKKYCHNETQLKFMLYAFWSWKTAWAVCQYGNFKFWNAKKIIEKYSEAQEGCPRTVTYTKNEIRDLFSDFDITSIEKTHIFAYDIEQYKKYVYQKSLTFKYMPKFVFDKMQSLLGWHMLVDVKMKNNNV